MSVWSDQIEADLKWREGEIASLKMLAAGAPHGSDRQRAILRALWAMLYAHYEGFCLFCWDLMLDAIEKSACKVGELHECFGKLAMAKRFSELKQDMSPDRLWSFFQTDFSSCLRRPVAFEKRLETESNLWPNLAIANNAAVGLNCKLFEKHSMELKALVARRNEIAHGKKMVIRDLKEYQQFEEAALLVMHELAVSVVTSIEQKSFLNGNAVPSASAP